MIKNKFLKLAILTIFFIQSISPVFALSVDPSFNPDKIIDDKVFADTQTFGGAEGIQKFLETKGSVLSNTSPEFIAKLKEPTVDALKAGLEDPRPSLGRLRTAAELIWDASIQSGLNPQVILVTLNKEQGLIDGRKNATQIELQKALDRAMGFDCPDATGCGNLFPGFYFQLFGNFDAEGNRYLGAAKSLMKSYNVTTGRGPIFNGKASQVGDMISLDNTMGGYDNILPQQTLTLSNRATAALYRFTPHVFNGNYNFWKFFQAWFKYPNGTLLKLAASADTYIIQNGVKQLVPAFVAVARGLDTSSTITVSPNEFDAYQTDKLLGPSDNTIVTAEGDAQKYVFINNIKHPASDLVIKQRGLDASKSLQVTPAEMQLFENGSVLPPKEGTIIRGTQDKTVYMVSNEKILAFSSTTFAQRKITAKQVLTVPDSEIAMYTKNGFVPPLDGTLVKSPSNGTVYIVQNGQKQPILSEVFKNRGFSYKNIKTISDEEVNSLVIGPYAQLKDYSFFSVAGVVYESKEGTKHIVSQFVAKQRGITPDYTFADSVSLTWPDGIPIPPKDNTIVMGDKDQTVYLVSKAQLRPLTYKAYTNRKITSKKISLLPQAEVDSYAKGDTLEK